MKRTLLILLCFTVLGIGCGSKKFSGTYVTDAAAIEGMGEPGSSLMQEHIFREDGTFETKSIETPAQGERREKSASGTYTLKGNDLTMVTTIEDGKPAPDSSRVPVPFQLSDDMKTLSLPGLPWVKYLKK